MPLLWLNGALLDATEARIDPADRGLLLGDGVFETVLARAGSACHLARHLARLRAGAAVLGIAPGWSDDQMADAAVGVLAGHGDAVLRITLTRGPAARGVVPAAGGRATLLITAGALPTQLPPARAVVVRGTRRNEHSPLARIKSLNYLDSILARQEAASVGADEGILLNTAGFVAEAAAGNLFVRHGGRWSTPPVGDGALPGIARALLLEGGGACEARLSEAGLAAAEAAVVSSALGVRVVGSVDGRDLEVEGGGFLRAVSVGV